MANQKAWLCKIVCSHEKPDVQHRKELDNVVLKPHMSSFYIHQHLEWMELKKNPNRNTDTHAFSLVSYNIRPSLTHTHTHQFAGTVKLFAKMLEGSP